MEQMTIEGMIAAIGLLVSVILLILLIALWAKMAKLRKTLVNMTAGAMEGNLEQVLLAIQGNIREMKTGIDNHDGRLGSLEQRLATMKGHVALHRYNAFNEAGRGSDMSFSLAIVDDAENGAVVTAIHGREETFVYGKPVRGGESDYKLTPEEREALSRATGRKNG